MPIAYRVDDDARIIVAAGHGVLTDADVFGYQRALRSRAGAAGYDELIDMTRVIAIAVLSGDRVRDLARFAAETDDTSSRPRLAIVAPADLAFGRGRMYQAYREFGSQRLKEVGAFRSKEEALAFLRVDQTVSMPELP